MHPWTTKVTVNKNFASSAHRDRKNQGHSAIALFGPFTGGALMVQEPTGRRKITEKRNGIYSMAQEMSTGWNLSKETDGAS